MTNTASLLVVNVSPRGARSISRRLADEFVASWTAAHPGDPVVVRDVANDPPPAVTEAWIEGAFTPPAQQSPAARTAITLSNIYVDELLAASEIVIAMPIYNFNIPAALKLWIDQIVRKDRTFSFDATGVRSLAGGRRLTVLVANSGDLRPGEPMGAMNFAEPYLRAIFRFIGITEIEFVYAHSQKTESHSSRFEEAVATIRSLLPSAAAIADESPLTESQTVEAMSAS
jgi:FMN-dependent NADH-azoreductase